MKCDKVEIKKDFGSQVPELSICWSVARMLSIPKFLGIFMDNISDYYRNIEVNKFNIIREHKVGNKIIDICIIMIDTDNNKHIVVIEAKVHWPDDVQLSKSIDIIKNDHSDFSTCIGLNIVTTNDKKQLTCLEEEVKNNKFKFTVLNVKQLLRLFCLSAIDDGYPLRYASDLQELFDCSLH